MNSEVPVDTGIAACNWGWATTLVDGLVACGVQRAVISPGSRSTPLALACARHPGMRIFVQIDERSAAFFALGLSRADGCPTAVVATSGSAPANWLPAVIEANYGAVPLILLSADRPPELRACGANQAIDQSRLFDGQVRFALDLGVAEHDPVSLRRLRALAAQAVDASRWPLPGPVHLNVPLREPLVPTDLTLPECAPLTPRASYPLSLLAPDEVARLATVLSGRAGVIVCGGAAYSSAFPDAVTALAERWSCPLLADPLSGLRFGGHDRSRVLARYDAFLRDEAFVATHRPGWVLRFGAMPVSRTLQRYLDGAPDAAHVLVDVQGRWLDSLHRVGTLLRADEAAVCAALAEVISGAPPSGWLDDFLAQEQRAAAMLAETGAPIEAGVIQRLIEHLPEGACLFSGNSMPIRDVDSFSGSAAKPLRILANRGASGIDGNVSTALGLAAARRAPVVALLGDLTLVHDLSGLLAARGLDATLVVLNNGGGGIFGYLPQAGLEDFERLWLTPAHLDFEQAAKLYGLGFQRVATLPDFEAAFAQALATPGVNLIEVRVDREESLACHRAYWAAMANPD